MYLKKSYYKDSGKTFLAIAKKVRNPETGIAADVTIENHWVIWKITWKSIKTPLRIFRKSPAK
jgi:hypothetical protein